MSEPGHIRRERKLGFIGCGTLTEAVVEGLCRHRPGRFDIALSPRSEAISRALAERFDTVVRHASNAEVVEAADIILLAVRPQQIDEALDGLTFRSGQIVVSFLAKTSCEDLQARLGKATIRKNATDATSLAAGPSICRVTPLPSIALGKGPILFYPRLDPVVAVFDGLGDAIFTRDEAEMMALGYSSGMLSSYFEFQNTLIDWLAQNGAQPSNASLYVRAMLEGLAATGKRTGDDQCAELPVKHETRAGLNERSRRHLLERGWFEEVRQALDLLHHKTNLAPDRGSQGSGGTR